MTLIAGVSRFDAVIDAINSLSDGSVPRLSVISNSVQSQNSSPRTVATAGTFDSYRVRHENKTGKRVRGIILAYTNNGRASNTETKGANRIKVKAALEPDGTLTDQSGHRRPLSFGGLQVAPIDAGMILYSDVRNVIIEAGAAAWERCGVTVENNGDVYYVSNSLAGGTAGFGMNTGEGYDIASDKIIDYAGNTTITTGNGYGATVMLGYLDDGTVAKSLAIFGDSIANGMDDAAAWKRGGWANRAFADYPAINLTQVGEKISQVADLRNCVTRWELALNCTHVLITHGRNDLSNGDTDSVIKANMLVKAKNIMRCGKVAILSTILPVTTSTDGWFTVANQSKVPNDTVRVAVNQWIRDTGPTGFIAQASAQVASLGILAGEARIVDICAAIECDATGTLTTDGGYILGAQSGLLESGTASSGSVSTLVDSAKAWTTNQFKGKSVYINSGTGAGQSACIAYNNATTLTLGTGWPTPPDATSTYRIFEALGFSTSVHPHSAAHQMIAASIDASAVMA